MTKSKPTRIARAATTMKDLAAFLNAAKILAAAVAPTAPAWAASMAHTVAQAAARVILAALN